MPDIIYDDESTIPEGLKEHAKKNDLGKFVVKVVAEAKLVEFRDNNIKLSKERDDLAKLWEKVSPLVKDGKVDEFLTGYKGLQETAQQVADGKLKGTDAIEGEVTKRTAAMRADFEKTAQAEAAKRVAAEERAVAAENKFKRSLVDRVVTDAVLNEKSGVQPAALSDILNRAYSVFIVDDNGNVIPKEGESTIYGADGSTPMTALEWIGTLKERAPYFFKGSSGGGANGNSGGDKIGGMTRAEFNKLPAATRLKMANEGKVKNAG